MTRLCNLQPSARAALGCSCMHRQAPPVVSQQDVGYGRRHHTDCHCWPADTSCTQACKRQAPRGMCSSATASPCQQADLGQLQKARGLLQALELLSLLLETALQVQHMLLQLSDAATQDLPAGQVVRNKIRSSSCSGLPFDLLRQPLPCDQNLQAMSWDVSMPMQMSQQQHTNPLLEGLQGNRIAQADVPFSVSVRTVWGTLLPQLLTSRLQAVGAASSVRRLPIHRC